MRTTILQAAVKVLMPIFLIYSLYLLFRGHDSPGGGFIAALVLSIGLIFHMIAFGVSTTQRTYKIDTMILTAGGLLLSFVSATLSIFLAGGFFYALWSDINIKGIGTISSVLLFDVGVYMAVTGAILKIAFAIFKK
ncbi:MnhB domain-containing protein [Olivibacter sp. CPCC 100613]|uniref:MnhB domain-containing protein n=1 Tax=Olivibacter sp. CPCC 100613 TaxID=3079931 RepID=UPI002FF6B24D